jgi:hypothetical protein
MQFPLVAFLLSAHQLSGLLFTRRMSSVVKTKLSLTRDAEQRYAKQHGANIVIGVDEAGKPYFAWSF